MSRRKRRLKLKSSVTSRSLRRSLKFSFKESTLREVRAVLYVGIALLLYLCLTNKAGPIGDTIGAYMRLLFGQGAYFFPLVLLIAAFILFFTQSVKFHLGKLAALFIGFGSILGIIHLQLPYEAQIDKVELYGGYIGFVTSFLLRHFFEEIATAFILGIIALASLIIVFDLTLSKIVVWFHPRNLPSLPKLRLPTIDISDEPEKKTEHDNKFEVIKIVKPKTIAETSEGAAASLSKMKARQENMFFDNTQPQAIHIASLQKEKTGENSQQKPKRDSSVYNDWKLPSLEILDNERSELEIDEKELRQKAAIIKEKLQQFGIDVIMKDVNVGPTVTQYTLEPSEGIKLTKITVLKNDLALALAATALRIEAPIPGKSLVGIEIPNDKRMIVHLRELLESKEFHAIKSQLRLVLGRDVSGKPVIADLYGMPHLLIAGRTGSGKSVCMNSFLISLLYQNSPRDLKFIMIDPKMVELAFYNGISHLLTPVITDIDKAISALRWAVAEMTRRYKELNQKKYRNITEYNEHEPEKMCKIVIVIDELADMMMRGSRKETEGLICRLAQMARAVGMHLIVATQRPSVDVITGIIKANIPTRVAFAVTAGVDSRTILDSYGAEDLLGHGDMLYLPGGMSGPVRIQGVWVSRKEIERVANHVKLTLEPEYDESFFADTPMHQSMLSDGSSQGGVSFDEFGEAEDDKFSEAVEVVKRTGKASATLLQRFMGIGYARAAKILDLMEQKGLIGPVRGAKPREIYMYDEEKKEEEVTV